MIALSPGHIEETDILLNLFLMNQSVVVPGITLTAVYELSKKYHLTLGLIIVQDNL